MRNVVLIIFFIFTVLISSVIVFAQNERVVYNYARDKVPLAELSDRINLL